MHKTASISIIFLLRKISYRLFYRNKNLFLSFLLPLIFFSFLEADIIEEKTLPSIRLVPVEPTPEASAIETRLAFPKEGEEVKNPVTLQMRIEGFSLGYPTELPRAKEIRDSKEGQAIRILIDNNFSYEANEAIDEFLDSEEADFNQTVKFTLPKKLPEGEHIIRLFLIRSYGEALKGKNSYKTSFFNVGKNSKKGLPSFDLSKPFITYNEPRGEFSGKNPLLLDFLVNNIQLSNDGYKVRVIIDKKDMRILTQEIPYYIYGLSPGSHTIELQLLDSHNKVVPPPTEKLEIKPQKISIQ